MSKDKKLIEEEAQKRIEAEKAARDMISTAGAVKGMLSTTEKEEREDLEDVSYAADTPSLNLCAKKPPKPVITSVAIPKKLMAEITKKAKSENVTKVRVINAILEKFFRGEFVEKKN